MPELARWGSIVALVGVFTLTGTAVSAAPLDDPPITDADLDDLAAAFEGLSIFTADPVLDHVLLAAASPDECWAGIGEPYPAGTIGPDGSLLCPDDSTPRVNQAYVWGLTKTGDDLWFGTAPNTHCLVLSTYLQTTAPATSGEGPQGGWQLLRLETEPFGTVPAGGPELPATGTSVPWMALISGVGLLAVGMAVSLAHHPIRRSRASIR